MQKRINWIDQVKGFTIFLVVYGHNFPISEKYIYSFHMPLFFVMAGLFHKERVSVDVFKRKMTGLLLPYFCWGGILYLFWLLIGRNYGVSSEMNYSPFKNLVGVLFAQGGAQYMDWGIPMWFLPALFLCFVFMSILRMIENNMFFLLSLFTVSTSGVLLSRYINYSFFWSIDVALVSLVFYAFGFYFKDGILNLKRSKYIIGLFVFGLLHLFLFQYNSKVDMYRSVYGNIFMFYLLGFSGSIFYLLLFSYFPCLKILEKLGRHTIVILALQLRAMTVIKLILYAIFGLTIFNFSEFEKLIYAILQIALILPIAFIINKYIPFLNGGKKSK